MLLRFPTLTPYMDIPLLYAQPSRKKIPGLCVCFQCESQARQDAHRTANSIRCWVPSPHGGVVITTEKLQICELLPTTVINRLIIVMSTIICSAYYFYRPKVFTHAVLQTCYFASLFHPTCLPTYSDAGKLSGHFLILSR